MDNDINSIISGIIDDSLIQAVISNPKYKTYEYKKILIRPVDIKGKSLYQVEKNTIDKVYHDNVEISEVADIITQFMEENLRQADIFTVDADYLVRISKKGKVTFNKKPATKKKTAASHNREKTYLLPEGKAVPALVDLGIMTADGRIVKSKYSKYRQINRFIEMVEDITDNFKNNDVINIIDFGCGKSYLTFVLYYYLTEIKEMNVNIKGLDIKEKVVDFCNLTADKYGYENLSFDLGDIGGYEADSRVDMVVSLHACDTATDAAIINAVRWNAKVILSVPCCQSEVNNQMKSDALNNLFEYGIIKERCAALFTDALRAKVLEIMGYKIQILEFVELKHSPKNLLIRAVKGNKINAVKADKIKKEYDDIIKMLGIEPSIGVLLKTDNTMKKDNNG